MKVRFLWLNVTAMVLLAVITGLILWKSILTDPTSAEAPHCELCARGTPCAGAKLDQILIRRGWMEPPKPEDGPLYSEAADRD
jgi:hypothetical protein